MQDRYKLGEKNDPSVIAERLLNANIKPDTALQAISLIGLIPTRPSLCLHYPQLGRIAKAGILNFPDQYGKARLQLEEIWEKPETEEPLRIARQARAITTLLEITEKELWGSDLVKDDPRYEILSRNLRSMQPIGVWTEDVGVQTYYGRRGKAFLAGQPLAIAVSHIDYLKKGWGSNYVYNLLILDLALSASGMYDKWTGITAPNQVFDQALLRFLTSQTPKKGSSGFRNLVATQIDANFERGIITPPPISSNLQYLLKEYQGVDFNDKQDPEYYLDELWKFWNGHKEKIIKAVHEHFVYETSLHPDINFRYQNLFQYLANHFQGQSIERILEVGCSIFGAAVGLSRTFVGTEIIGCDLISPQELLNHCRPDVKQMLDSGKLAYWQWDISKGIIYFIKEKLQRTGSSFDIITLLNSAYPHLNEEGRVVALETVLQLAKKAVVVAGGFGMNKMKSAENPQEDKPEGKGNAWIFYKQQDGSLRCEGFLYE